MSEPVSEPEDNVLVRQPEPKFVGVADGPTVYVPELGCDTPTFTLPPGGKYPALNYHVPVLQRGPFRAQQLANWNPKKQYRTDKLGWVLCHEKISTGELCKRKAVNRFPRCNFHGGRVHPLDKLVDETAELTEGTDSDTAASRYQQFLAGQLTIHDLDDEEIMNFGFRTSDGRRIFKPKNITRDMVNAFTKAIYDRALENLKTNALHAVKTLTTIMMDTDVDPPVRVKAATEILDRTLGKAPQTVQLVGEAPWEQLFEGIASVTREESRLARGMVVDAEVVEEVNNDLAQPKSHALRELLED